MRPRRRWEENIRMDLEKICINEGNWVDSAQDRDCWRDLVNSALNLRVPIAMELVIYVLGQCLFLHRKLKCQFYLFVLNFLTFYQV